MFINHGLWNCPISKNILKNRKRLDNTTSHYSAPSTPSYSYNKLNEYTDIARKEITAETHYRKDFALDNKPSVIIKNKYESNPCSKYMLI